MTIMQNHSLSRKDLVLVTFGHRITLQLRVSFSYHTLPPTTQLVTSIQYQLVKNPLIFTQLGQFSPQYTTITGFRLWVQKPRSQ